MKNEDKKDFLQLLNDTFLMYSKDAPGLDIVRIYFDDLAEYDFLIVKKAFEMYRKTPGMCKFIPKSGDIISIIEGSGEEMAEIAWKKALSAVKHFGQYDSIVFDDPVIHNAIDAIGGWPAFCSSLTKENETFEWASFRKIYNHFSVRKQPHKQYLKGLYDVGQKFLNVCGNKEKCRLVYDTGTDEHDVKLLSNDSCGKVSG